MHSRRHSWDLPSARPQMPEFELPDLTFAKMAYGTHQVPWDLRALMYRGGAASDRATVLSQIAKGELGAPMLERLPLVQAIHGAIETVLVGGGSRHTVRSQLERMHFFFAWCDKSDSPLNLATAQARFKDWSEALLHRVRVDKTLTKAGCYTLAMRVATTLGDALQLHGRPGSALLRTTRIRAPRQKKKGASASAKQNLEDTFEFGHFLTSLCETLSPEAMAGLLPIEVTAPNGSSVYVKGYLKQGSPDFTAGLETKARRALAESSRAPIETSDVIRRRAAIFNLRLEAELLLFCAQTGMNLAQAAQLERVRFRFQTDGEDVVARSFKQRRQGEVIFRAYRLYREHLRNYLAFLDAFIPAEEGGRLFPFVYVGKVPPTHVLPRFRAVRDHAERAGVAYVGPRQLRKTRVNWLLRRSRDVALTATMSAHSEATLLAHYEESHHQSAAVEITRFHQATDPTYSAPGPGTCTHNSRKPRAVDERPISAPEPDCISPDGCVFCVHHRDVMSADYCWKVASHIRIKSVELMRYKPPKNAESGHPAAATIDALVAKLDAIAAEGAVRALWVSDARDAVRSGCYHPEWDGHIRLLECFL